MSIEDGLRRVTGAVRERIPELYEAIRLRLQAETPDYSLAGNEQLSTAESATITASLHDVLDYLADPASGPVRASNEALREVRMAARAGVSLQLLLRGSRVAQSATWDFLLEEAHRLIERDAERIVVLRRASAQHFAWNQIVSDAIVEAFEQESSANVLQSRERRKLSTLNAVLAGLPVDTAELDYTFDGLHLAARVAGAPSEAVAAAAATKTGTRALVATYPGGDGVFWLPWSARYGAPAERLGKLDWPAGARIAFGAVGAGVEGFRLSYRQAGDARTVAETLDRSVVWYDEIMLEALAVHDPVATRGVGGGRRTPPPRAGVAAHRRVGNRPPLLGAGGERRRAAPP
ncbi:hypothetical protein ACFXPA_11710, partial [Amycolatopsis sp. NPDC059090]|uniref:hypothetical protein n=1 Tax=Amycolatopsis sp. NPDC059090 TaxID=3346723 RepID=UPI00366EABEC